MSEIDERTAMEIVDIIGDCPTPLHWEQHKRWLKAKIAAALAAERAKWKAFADENGEPMPVHGQLPVTADKVIAGDGAQVFVRPWGGLPSVYTSRVKGSHVPATQWEPETPIHQCYSTKEAATSALDAAKEHK